MSRHRLATSSGKPPIPAFIDMIVQGASSCGDRVSSLMYATSDGTATAGADYTADSGTLSFAIGETEKTVSVTVLDDTHRC